MRGSKMTCNIFGEKDSKQHGTESSEGVAENYVST